MFSLGYRAAVSDASRGLQLDFSFFVSGEGSVGFDDQRLRAVDEIEVTIKPTEIRVSDNGIGMTKDELIRHYWRAGSSGKKEGSTRAG